MIHKIWQDCQLTTEGEQILLGNSVVTTRWRSTDMGLALVAVEDRKSGFCWKSKAESAVLPACMAFDSAVPRWETEISQDPLTAPHWIIRCTWHSRGKTLQRIFLLYPQCPFLTLETVWTGIQPDETCLGAGVSEDPRGLESEDQKEQDGLCVLPGDIMMSIPLPEGQLRWHSIRFADQTDIHDTLVFDQTALVYDRENLSLSANLFSLEDISSGSCLLLGRHAPITPSEGGQFLVQDRILSVMQNGCAGVLPESATGCSCILGVGQWVSIQQDYRHFYRLGWQAPWQMHGLMVSNTWGDRNRDSRVTESFIMGEIQQASLLGLDIVQIDDGWQKGATINSAVSSGGVWEGYYSAQEDFWTPHPTRFPNGLRPLVLYARSLGVRLGLWFSPDSSRDFGNWQRDAETLLYYYQQIGITVFKLDGVNLLTPTARKHYLRFLDAVTSATNHQVVLQQDITAQQRMGYLSRREIGTLFVENRYTDFHNYFPHRTLRNLWMLSRWIPSQRFLFEILNTQRNQNLYEGDCLAPGLYSEDYLFASVMVSQPLFWMELSGMSEPQIETLKPIILLYRFCRDTMWQCDVQPIGQEPDGFSFTGFLLTEPTEERSGYLLVFRENAKESQYSFTGLTREIDLELLYSSKPVWNEEITGTSVTLHFVEQRSFAFYRWIQKTEECT